MHIMDSVVVPTSRLPRPSALRDRRLRIARRLLALFVLLFLHPGLLPAQTPADSVTITFRAHQAPAPTLFVPGQFNNWGPNASGVISPGAPSQMTYSAGAGAWLKTYTFKIHDPSDARRTLGDSVFQYKFNRGGGSSGWYSDPLNPEQNPADASNSVLRLTKLFWFEYYGLETTTQLTRITASIVHANNAHVTSVVFRTGPTANSLLTSTDVTSAYDTATRILDFTSGLPVAKSNYVRLVAFTDGGDSIVYAEGGYAVTVSPLPPYAKHGVTLPSPSSNDSVTFRLRVSGKDYVLVRIAPVGQIPANAAPVVMRKAPNPADWWVNVALAPGTYEYVYEIENGRLISDPWGRFSGTNGSRFTVGPAGLTADNYVWNTASYVRPPLDELVIYELNVGEFAGGYFNLGGGEATFADLAALLPYFDSLGVNALELMPITDYQQIGLSGFSWGYDLSSQFAIEPAYGTPAMFKAFVDSAHAHGIAVILDAVFNHLNDPGPLWQMQPDEATNPYFKLVGDVRPNEDGLAFFRDMDHWTPETQELVLAALKMWIDEYRVDGFRYDYTQGIGWSLADTTKGILGWANAIARDYNGSVYQIAEHLPESPALLYHSGLTSGWHDSFHDELFDEARFENTAVSSVEDLVIGLGAYPGNDNPGVPANYATKTEPVNATVTHDEQTLIYEMTTFQGDPLNVAIARDKLYAAFMFTSLGIPMLWQGMEFSAPRGWQNDGEKLSYRPLEWSLYPTARGQSHYRHYRSLAMQRRHNPALTHGVYEPLMQSGAEKVIAWDLFDTSTGATVVVVANMSAVERTPANIPWPGTGVWYDIFDQSQLLVADSLLPSLSVPAFTAKIYANRSDSALGIVTARAEEAAFVPGEFRVAQNYPNPFNATTHFLVDLPRAEELTLTVYDILGREVGKIATGRMQPGTHAIAWNAGDHPSGVYLYRITSASFRSGGKMILLR